MLTSAQDCRTNGDLLPGHVLSVPNPDEMSTVRARPDSRDGDHCVTAAPAHLFLLRKALAHESGRQQPSYLSGSAGCRHGSRHRCRRHGAARGGVATSLTLSQWVSRISCVG